jgi:hypothetical protein
VPFFLVIASEAWQSMVRFVPRGDSQIDWIGSCHAMTGAGGELLGAEPKIEAQKNPNGINLCLQNTFVQV